MINITEKDEKEYLMKICSLIKEKFAAFQEKFEITIRDTAETKKNIWENSAEMDSGEKASARTMVSDLIGIGENTDQIRMGLQKLLDSPYFARIDFKDELGILPIYIGIRGFQEEENRNIIIYDWRAPISSIFYDFDKGVAHFISPGGLIKGEILVKRQYKIKNATMEYMIESDVSIDDDILKKELSSTSDEKMKNIVATIQKEQNQVIRNENASTLIIQGAAGSGKTSIALHRIAFLLYRLKNTVKSSDMLILSPNKVFGDYISNVLPELGEDNLHEICFEDIASQILGKRVAFQTFSQQVAILLDTDEERMKKRIELKASITFLNELDDYFKWIESTIFNPLDLTLKGVRISKGKITSYYKNMSSLPLNTRIRKVVSDMTKRMKLLLREQDIKWEKSFTIDIKKQLLGMFLFHNSASIYKNFFSMRNQDHYFVIGTKKEYEYCDVFPLIYTMLFFEEVEDYGYVKHLLVDEMQDYTPIQYAVLSKLFHCKMTILGDSNQSINPYSASNLRKIQKIFPDSECIKLCKSYRSTIEITEFAQKISCNWDLVPIERHGEAPKMIKCKSQLDQTNKILQYIKEYEKSSFSTLGIICRTQREANDFYELLKMKGVEATLLDFDSSSYSDGIIVINGHMAKGLEFDQVIIPNVSDILFKTEMDKKILYVACTRAMHKLDLFYFGNKSELV